MIHLSAVARHAASLYVGGVFLSSVVLGFLSGSEGISIEVVPLLFFWPVVVPILLACVVVGFLFDMGVAVRRNLP